MLVNPMSSMASLFLASLAFRILMWCSGVDRSAESTGCRLGRESLRDAMKISANTKGNVSVGMPHGVRTTFMAPCDL